MGCLISCLFPKPSGITSDRPALTPIAIDVANGKVELTCGVEGILPGLVRWFRDGVEIPSPEVEMTRTSSKLILSVDEADKGTFEARVNVENVVCKSTAVVQLKDDSGSKEAAQSPKRPYLEAPIFISELTPLKVMDGEEAILRCQVTGKPTPRLTWYCNGEPVREHRGLSIVRYPSGVAELKIAEVFPEESGIYSCKAVNKAGEALTEATLAVEKYEYIPDSESSSLAHTSKEDDATGPSGSEDDLLEEDSGMASAAALSKSLVTNLTPEVQVEEGVPAVFEVFIGDAKPENVKWFLNAREVRPSSEFEVITKEGKSILRINEVLSEDSGDIVCQVQTPDGPEHTFSRLMVGEYRDTKMYRKPDWVTRMEEIQAQLRGRNMSTSTSMSRDSLECLHFEHIYASDGDDSVFYSNPEAVCNSSSDIRNRRLSGVSLCDSLPVVHESSNSSKHVSFSKPQLVIVDHRLGEGEEVRSPETHLLAPASIFAQSILKDYLSSHRKSISATIEALSCEGLTTTENSNRITVYKRELSVSLPDLSVLGESEPMGSDHVSESTVSQTSSMLEFLALENAIENDLENTEDCDYISSISDDDTVVGEDEYEDMKTNYAENLRSRLGLDFSHNKILSPILELGETPTSEISYKHGMPGPRIAMHEWVPISNGCPLPGQGSSEDLEDFSY